MSSRDPPGPSIQVADSSAGTPEGSAGGRMEAAHQRRERMATMAEESAPTRARTSIGGLGLVAVGGALGSLARWAVSEFLIVGEPAGWPVATLCVNLLGAFLLGLLFAAIPAGGTAEATRARLLLGTGVLGGFTTYSLLATQLAERILAGQLGVALGTGLTTLVGGALATLLGIWVAGAIRHRSPDRAVGGSR